LIAAAPDDIARWIVALNDWRLANYRPMQGTDPILHPSFTSANKVGRNDPCPCGSGSPMPETWLRSRVRIQIAASENIQ
jgi:hypothetical protein